MGVSDKTRSRLVLGAGDLTVDGVDVGATTDKTILRIVQEIYEPHFDGVLGPLEESLHRTRLVASLECTVMEFRDDLLELFYLGYLYGSRAVLGWGEGMWGAMVWGGVGSPIMEFRPILGNYDVVWTGQDCDGDAIVVTLENAAQIKNLEVAIKDTEEAKFGLKFLTAYDSEDPGHVPFSVVVGTI